MLAKIILNADAVAPQNQIRESVRLVRHREGDEFGPDRTSGPFLYRAPAVLTSKR
jgi:hypothetical protein